MDVENQNSVSRAIPLDYFVADAFGCFSNSANFWKLKHTRTQMTQHSPTSKTITNEHARPSSGNRLRRDMNHTPPTTNQRMPNTTNEIYNGAKDSISGTAVVLVCGVFSSSGAKCSKRWHRKSVHSVCHHNERNEGTRTSEAQIHTALGGWDRGQSSKELWSPRCVAWEES